MFASNGAVFAALLPWYPVLSARLHIGPAEFGFIVAAFAVGAIVSSAAPTPLIRRFGPARVAVAGTVLIAIAVASAPWGGMGWMLAVSLFFVGLFDAVVDVAQNVAGIRVEDAGSRHILSSMHALWSLGGVVGGAASTAAAALGADVRVYLACAAVMAVLLVGAGAGLLGDLAAPPAPEPDARGSEGQSTRWKAVAIVALPLVVIAISGTMVEDIANNWAAMAGVQLGGVTPSVAGIAFTIIIGSQCIGRFTGDRLIDRFGRRTVARIGGALIALGGTLVITTDDTLWQLLIGFALSGYGSATIVPSALAAASKLPGVGESAGVTLVSWLMRVGFLITSPLIGSVTAATSLRWGLAILIPVGIAAFLLARTLAPRRSAQHHDPVPVR
jgi:MFS family permease